MHKCLTSKLSRDGIVWLLSLATGAGKIAAAWDRVQADTQEEEMIPCLMAYCTSSELVVMASSSMILDL